MERLEKGTKHRTFWEMTPKMECSGKWPQKMEYSGKWRQKMGYSRKR